MATRTKFKSQTKTTTYRLTFERNPRARKPPPPLYIQVSEDEPSAPVRTSSDRKKWADTRWTTQDMRGDNLRLVLLLIDDIPGPRTTESFQQWSEPLGGWLNRTSYSMTEAEIQEAERRALAEAPRKRAR